MNSFWLSAKACEVLVGIPLPQRYLTPSDFPRGGHTHLRRENAPKSREGVIQSLVVDGILQVFDKDVAHTRLPKAWVSVGPHDSDGLAFDHLKVHCV
jgi:hypothetical protein